MSKMQSNQKDIIAYKAKTSHFISPDGAHICYENPR